MASYIQRYDFSNKCSGVVDLADNTWIPKPLPGAVPHPKWLIFLTWNAAQVTPLSLADLAPPIIKTPRTFAQVRSSVVALNVVQRDTLITNILTRFMMEHPQDAAAFGIVVET